MMKSIPTIIGPLTAVFLVIHSGGCTSTPPTRPLTQEEIAKRDYSIGHQLVQKLESQVTFRQDVEVSVFLRRLAQDLANTTDELRTTPVGVFLAINKDKRWQNFSVPGNRIYISVGLLKQLEFENEVGAAIALELAHLAKRHIINKLAALSPHLAKDADTHINPVQAGVEFFGPSGIFTLNEVDLMASTELAVRMLYRAGLDPRGLSSLWAKYRVNPDKSPYKQDTIERLIDHTRLMLAQYSPLRNPVVRSQAFLIIQKRIQKL